MNQNKKVFLVDLDNTLIDTDKLRESLTEKFVTKFGQEQRQLFIDTQDAVAKELGVLDITEVANRLADTLKTKPEGILEIYTRAPFNEYIVPRALELLRILKSLGHVLIYSKGDRLFQSPKISTTDIGKIIDPEKVFIFKDKESEIENMVNKLKDQGYSEFTFIDDRADFLIKCKEVDPNFTCIRIKYGKHIVQPDPPNLDFIATSLSQIIDYFFPYQIKKGLDEKQIQELLQYTKNDPDVQKFTSDPERFKDRLSFNKWLKKGRVIYCLSDNKDNLMGIIWFAKEKFKSYKKNPHYSAAKYPYTFAIRMYSSARGKGLAKYFMDFCFEDFGKKGIWLTTSADNTPAVKLYTNFGFKQIPDANPYNKIVMVYE